MDYYAPAHSLLSLALSLPWPLLLFILIYFIGLECDWWEG